LQPAALTAVAAAGFAIDKRGRDTPEPPEHAVQHEQFSEEDRTRFQDATHLIWVTATDSGPSLRSGLWATFAAARAAAETYDGVVVDPSCTRLVPSAEGWPVPSDGRILVKKHVRIWYSQSETGLCWMTTTGMPKFGVPNLEMNDIPPNLVRPAMHLVNAVSWRLMAMSATSATAQLNASELELTLDDLEAAYGEPHQALPNASGRITIDLEYPGGQDVGAKFVRLRAPEGAHQPTWFASGLSEWLGSADESSHTSQEHLASAREHAQSELAALRARFVSGLPPGQVLFVKAPFRIDESHNEYMWIVVTRWDNGGLHGLLANDPTHVKGLRDGDAVSLSDSEVWDWELQGPGAKREGNFGSRSAG